MTDADPAFWAGHAPLLFPIVGSLNGDRYRVNGREYELCRHGFARHTPFEVIDAGESEARFLLRDSDETRAVYPFAFELELVFRLQGATLYVEATVRNPGRSEEHTSELQSLMRISYAVFCLKKKNKT